VTAPGGLTPVEQTIEIEGVEFVDDFYTIYVYSYYPVTAFQSFILKDDPRMDITTMTARQKDTSWRDQFLAGQVSKLVSLTSSLINAYQLAAEIDDTIRIDYSFQGLYVYYRPSRLTELEIGDEIVEINGESYLDHDQQSFTALASSREVTLKIKRIVDSEEIFKTVSYTLEEDEPSLIFYPNYAIHEATPQFTLPGLNTVIGGPSGGMIQTLSIYASLLKINISGIKIAGTGTINIDGMIGRIGGITQKMYTAIDENVDVFFLPIGHIDEIPDLEYPYEIIVVSTIREAVQALYEVID
jgi:PDZ domain-containing protein